MTTKERVVIVGDCGIGIDFARKLCKRLEEKGIIKNSAIAVSADFPSEDRIAIGLPKESQMFELLQKEVEELIIMQGLNDEHLSKGNNYVQHKNKYMFMNKSNKRRKTKR